MPFFDVLSHSPTQCKSFPYFASERFRYIMKIDENFFVADVRIFAISTQYPYFSFDIFTFVTVANSGKNNSLPLFSRQYQISEDKNKYMPVTRIFEFFTKSHRVQQVSIRFSAGFRTYNAISLLSELTEFRYL